MAMGKSEQPHHGRHWSRCQPPDLDADSPRIQPVRALQAYSESRVLAGCQRVHRISVVRLCDWYMVDSRFDNRCPHRVSFGSVGVVCVCVRRCCFRHWISIRHLRLSRCASTASSYWRVLALACHPTCHAVGAWLCSIALELLQSAEVTRGLWLTPAARRPVRRFHPCTL